MKKEWQVRETTTEVVVGAFVLMVLLGLGYFTIILTRENLFQKKFTREVLFTDVMGLRDGDSVVVRGMPVGKVKSLDLKQDGVHVLLSLDQDIRPHDDYKIIIISTSILGGRYLEIKEGQAEHLVSDGVVLRGEVPQNLMEDAAEAVSAIKKGLTEGGIIDNLKKTLADISQVAERLNQGKGTLGKLLSEDDTIYADLKATTASLKEITGRLERGEGTLGKLFSKDDQLYRDVSETAASLKNITAKIEHGEGTLGKLMSKDDSIYTDLKETLGSLKNITAKIEKGEGTLGKLVNDDTAYQEMTRTLGDARAAIDDFRENTPVVTFTSILLGAW
jgi:phospholipid/cholesterol/gamma-HCH transport system substrate-binding protein